MHMYCILKVMIINLFKSAVCNVLQQKRSIKIAVKTLTQKPVSFNQP